MKRQSTLGEAWGQGGKSKRTAEQVAAADSESDREAMEFGNADTTEQVALLPDSGNRCSGMIEQTEPDSDGDVHLREPTRLVTSRAECDARCCLDYKKAFQPTDKQTLTLLDQYKRKFMPSWYEKFPWISVCITNKTVFCGCCRYGHNTALFQTFAKRAETAFTIDGFCNWKKALEKFSKHERSDAHCLAMEKWVNVDKPNISEKCAIHLTSLQRQRREGFLKQLLALKFLLRQGLSIKGHKETEGNLSQLLGVWKSGCPNLQLFLREGKYMSHDVVNELITLIGREITKNILSKINQQHPSWYAIIADGASDVSTKEQLSVCIRSVDGNYVVSEDPIGLYNLPNTTSETIALAIKDVLRRCILPLSNCRGQAYDGAAANMGRRTGVAVRIRSEAPAAVQVHCLAHCLNLCLQDAGRKSEILKNTLDLVREIAKLIKFSPKRQELFSQNLQQNLTVESNADEASTGPKRLIGIKPLCPTRWTVRTAAINAVIVNYHILLETMEEIALTTKDDYGLKAYGIFSALRKFQTLFGLKLGHLLFSAAEEVSKALQAVDTSIQEAMTSVNVAAQYYNRHRTDVEYEKFYASAIKLATDLDLEGPCLSRPRRQPRRVDDGSSPHVHDTPKVFFRQRYFEACDILINDLKDRFDQKEVMEPLLTIESLLLKAANSRAYEDAWKKFCCSCYKEDLDIESLDSQLKLMYDAIHQELPQVKEITSIRTICQALNANQGLKILLSEVHKLVRLFLTVPISSATSERTFSALRRVKTYLRSTITQKRLNNCLLVHMYKEIADNVNLSDVAKSFVQLDDSRRKHFGSF
ncbi:zinc finger MYM-type protein 1-like [Corticium candelabrum]|uniref:zinc finger MYM-type protein 1-like n=1 Tax=Corticium candelabrum TaxID=121492 RepID=UPI002E2563C6|nr:zinc finger MYM-type protein 1-like [Corticium candelabrum]